MKKLLIIFLSLAGTASYAVEPDYAQAEQEYAQYQRDMGTSSYSSSPVIKNFLPALLETPAPTSDYTESTYQEPAQKNPIINKMLDKVYNFVNE